MIYLFHGEHQGASRQALTELKKNYPSSAVSIFEAASVDPWELFRSLKTPALFSPKRLIILEGKPALELLERLDVGANNAEVTADLAIWVGEELKPSDQLWRWIKEKGGTIKLFRHTVPQHVFGLLDALSFKQQKKALLELHRLLARGESPFFLLSMINWQLRNLLWVKFAPSGKGALPKISPYVLKKLRASQNKFQSVELIRLYKKLLEAELKLKTGAQDPLLVLDRLVYDITRN